MPNLNFQKKLKREGVLLVYLFGSQVSGFTHKESDIDIAVFLNKKVKPKEYFEKSFKLAILFKEIYPGKERQITILNEASPLIKHEVIKTGKLLFSVDEKERIKFELNTLRYYEDTKPLRQIQYFYLKKRIKKAVKSIS